MIPQPFITFYTPTFRRPQQLAACLASVQAQQIADGAIEQIVIPDHVGIGIAGMFERIGDYAEAVHGRYVHVLADDDQLASPMAVWAVREAAEAFDYPALLLVRSRKAGLELPLDASPWPPVCGRIDLGCLITRSDIWKQHAHGYGRCYEGDYVFAQRLHDAGIVPVVLDVLFVQGAVSRGVSEDLAVAG